MVRGAFCRGVCLGGGLIVHEDKISRIDNPVSE